METKTLTRIGPGSVGKMLGALYAVIGLIFGGFFSLMSVAGIAVAEEAQPGGAFMALGMLIFLPVFYGVMGYVAGAFSAFLYNIIAKRIGGVVFEME